jgi:hypothetical protein
MFDLKMNMFDPNVATFEAPFEHLGPPGASGGSRADGLAAGVFAPLSSFGIIAPHVIATAPSLPSPIGYNGGGLKNLCSSVPHLWQ